MSERVQAVAGLADADYAWAYELATSQDVRVPAERWARSVFEGAPLLVRGFLSAGWTYGLGLRLGSRRSAQHVLGWRVAALDDDMIILRADSRFVDARNVVMVGDSSVTWVTLVRGRNRFGAALWLLAAPIHQLTLPWFLAHARRSVERSLIQG